VAAAARLNVMGTQFHPEKSGVDGLRVYANFLAFCGGG
jgi:imidazoleglycerol phosphate synthase glutamine amidotransferase subunit HisH